MNFKSESYSRSNHILIFAIYPSAHELRYITFGAFKSSTRLFLNTCYCVLQVKVSLSIIDFSKRVICVTTNLMILCRGRWAVVGPPYNLCNILGKF